MKKFTLNKDERIKRKKLIDSIFTNGESIKHRFIRINYIITKFESDYPVKVAFSVPKKIFKRAVKRNLLKRKMKEVYRLNKNSLYEFLTIKNLKISLLFVYLAKDVKTYNEIEENILEIIQKLKTEIENKY